MSSEIEEKTEKLREFMFENVYYNKVAKSEEEKAEYIIKELYGFYLENPHEMPYEYQEAYYSNNSSIEDRICDYIAGMTDRYVIHTFKNLFVPKPWEKY